MIDFSKLLENKVASLDLETACGVKDCPGYDASNSSQCNHAVHFKHNQIKIIGVYDGKDYFLFRTVREFDSYRGENPRIGFVGHGVKFDYKSLKSGGSTIRARDIMGDTQVLGSAVAKKVPDDFLKVYNERRAILNATLPQKQRHRPGTPLTLKTMAPFYLGVEPFWENPSNHDDPEYNKKDCVYTYRLHELLLQHAEQDETLEFYNKYLMPWSKLLAEAEYEGILIDTVQLHAMYQQALLDAGKLEEVIHKDSEEAFKRYIEGKKRLIKKQTDAKCSAFIATRIKDQAKCAGVVDRYNEGLAAKLEKLPSRFNLQSPIQVKVILENHGIDMTVEKRDKESNAWIETEGTDKFVLIRAKVKGNKFAEKMLAYREKETEVSYLKQYIEAVTESRIHCTFNITGTRTGRLSSSGPNLQNVKGSLRLPFIVADNEKYSIYTVDSSQIEPRLVAYLTADPEMVQLFIEGRDYHNYATKKFFPAETADVPESDIKSKNSHLRKTAKIGDLSIIYGTGAATFQTMCLVREEMDIPLERCQDMVYSFRQGMQGVFQWKRNLEDKYKAGYPIHDIFGSLVQAREGKIHMTLFNTFVQGMASRAIFHASLMARRHFAKFKIDAKPLAWIHDEVVWRFPKGKEDFCRKTVDYFMNCYILETPHGKVPLEVEGNLDTCWKK